MEVLPNDKVASNNDHEFVEGSNENEVVSSGVDTIFEFTDTGACQEKARIKQRWGRGKVANSNKSYAFLQAKKSLGKAKKCLSKKATVLKGKQKVDNQWGSRVNGNSFGLKRSKREISPIEVHDDFHGRGSYRARLQDQYVPVVEAPPTVKERSRYTHRSVETLIVVLAVITIIGVVTGIIARLCGGRHFGGNGENDIEGWIERSCIDGGVPAAAPEESKLATQEEKK
ncbi:hypothetical protein PTKIN_Ptkin06aG0092700 [Pterospermum kingtungense]